MATLEALNERHALSILLYVYRHDGCMKTELYSGVNSRSRLPEKIQGLDDAGLLKQDVARSTRLYITDPGKQVASKLVEIEEILEGIED